MRRASALAMAFLMTGCMVGPDYRRPPALLSLHYKELSGWVPAQPADTTPKGAWWETFHDPLLNRLEARVAVSNQNVAVYQADYEQAKAIIQETRAQLFPVLGATAGVTRSSVGNRSSAVTTTGGTSLSTSGTTTGTVGTGTTSTATTAGVAAFGGSVTRTEYVLQGTASWDLDLWGRIRRQVQSDVAAAQVSAADLANATLSAQGSLATDYMELRYEDSLAALLRATVAAYQKTLDITRNQVAAGVTSPASEAQAETQLASAQASLVNLAVARGQYEHAIAVLAGLPPAELTIPPAPLTSSVPVAPAGLPSTLLQRRPDIAAAERLMDEENALIGVQVAAFYPDVTLSADFGWEGGPIGVLISAANRVWSLGANATETLFEGGERSQAVRAARAAYDASVATYRQTVLSALEQVEDELVALHTLQLQTVAEDYAVRTAQRSVDIAVNEYRAGTQAYTTVVTEQTALLSAQETALSVQEQRLVASVTLIQALGGGWDTSELPGRLKLQSKLPFM